MAWATPEFSLPRVNQAGRELATRQFPMSVDETLQIVNNWRSAHAFPLNTFQVYLRKKACEIETKPVIAQRTKRLESIHAKLTRQQTDNMRLTQMQDIGGCRAVLSSVRNVRSLVQRFTRARFKHIHRNSKDYIQYPKPDGYRSYHLVYEYRGGKAHTRVWDGLKIEIQLRTQLQHAWATSVEAVDTFTRQALKANRGDEDWQRFFALMSAAIAAMEKCPSVPDTPTTRAELRRQITELATRLSVVERLKAYSVSLKNVKREKNEKYFVLNLDFDTRLVTLWGFGENQSSMANEYYTRVESENSEVQNRQVVLVSVDSVNALKRAYPNYFLDTRRFAELVDRAIAGRFPEPIIAQPSLFPPGAL
jgi:ppGpp synthetase/RelA/SpoT-type nucleotidyltranferase